LNWAHEPVEVHGFNFKKNTVTHTIELVGILDKKAKILNDENRKVILLHDSKYVCCPKDHLDLISVGGFVSVKPLVFEDNELAILVTKPNNGKVNQNG